LFVCLHGPDVAMTTFPEDFVELPKKYGTLQIIMVQSQDTTGWSSLKEEEKEEEKITEEQERISNL
jgi:hypothetical protein